MKLDKNHAVKGGITAGTTVVGASVNHLLVSKVVPEKFRKWTGAAGLLAGVAISTLAKTKNPKTNAAIQGFGSGMAVYSGMSLLTQFSQSGATVAADSPAIEGIKEMLADVLPQNPLFYGHGFGNLDIEDAMIVDTYLPESTATTAEYLGSTENTAEYL